MSHILLVEDEQIIRTALRRLLERHNYQVSEAGSVTEALEQFGISDFDLIISDLRLPGHLGTELINHVGNTPVLIMTSYASLRSAVDAMRLGAVDYIAKPFDHDEMLQTICTILGQHGAPAPAIDSTEQPISNELGIIGRSPQMQELFKKIRKVAPTDSNVLVLGESGTGKELVAKALHKLSRRGVGPLISVNCAAIPETLIESELFGHEKGAFTGANSNRTGLIEAAHGGTLFLDEIGELPLEAQARLLRVLQEGEIRRVGAIQSQKVDVRLVAATHRDLKKRASTGQFREDLYYRLNVIALTLPPLRERGQDVLEIAETFLQRRSSHQEESLHFSQEARRAILTYDWPGNVRELENAIERAAILTDDQQINLEHLGIDSSPRDSTNQPHTNKNSSPLSASPTPDSNLSLEDYFQQFVLEHQEHMTETELARQLGISRKCLWERRQRLGIPRRRQSHLE